MKDLDLLAEKVASLISDKLLVSKDISELKAQYRILSELSEFFPKDSRHKAALFIEKKMSEIIEKIG